MSSEKLTKLESFVERHRPDFDAHEPSPDLWARLEQELAQPGPGVGPVLLADNALETEATLAPETFQPAAVAQLPLPVAPLKVTSRRPWTHYGVAAALATLVFAAVFSEAHRPAPSASTLAATAADEDSSSSTAPVDAAYFGPAPQALAASEHLGGAADPRLGAAVRGMETYYAAQLSARQAELRELDAQNPAADWPRELAQLDSSYNQLKEELPHHPQPEVVLTAMNRNLQIRLDILDQQLQHRATGNDELTTVPGGTMVSLADSRP